MAKKNAVVRVRVLATYPSADASRRLRVDPIVNLLPSSDDVRVDTIFSERAFAWKNGTLGRRAWASLSVLFGLIRRLILVCLTSQDLLIVHREVFPFFPPLLERVAAKRSTVSLLDIDDATYSNPTHGRDWRRFLRRPERVLDFRDLFDVVSCGNQELVEHFSNGRARTLGYPTCPDASSRDLARRPERLIVWIGSASTLVNLESVLPAVLRACVRLNARLEVLGAENVRSLAPHERLRAAVWSAELERDALQRAALGIMPLEDTEWDRGKSGFKAILYLCAGVPSLVSAVGINRQLIARYPDWVFGVTDPGSWEEAVVSQFASAGPGSPESLIEAHAYFDGEARAKEVLSALPSFREGGL